MLHNKMSFTFSSEVVIGISTLVVVIGSVLYYKISSNTSKSITTNKTNSDVSNDSNRGRSYSNLEEKYPAGKMSIYFGSQTGTAEGFARVIMSDAHKSGFDAKLIDLEDYEPEQLQSCRLAVFLIATYGEGDPTDNAAKFFEWMKNEDGSIEDGFLSNVDFCVFGLGNSQYENYNRMGRLMNEGLEKLGARRVFQYMEGDDDATLEDDFESWKGQVVPALVQKYHPSAEKVEDTHSTKAVLTFRCAPCAPSPAVIPSAQLINSSTKHFFTSPEATVTCNREMRTPADGGHTVHMELDISGTGVSYYTADNLAVIPDNSVEVVEAFSKCCGGFDLDQYIDIEPVFPDADVEDVDPSAVPNFKHPFPTPCTTREIFTRFLDIDSIPRRSVIEQLAAYVTDEKQKAWLVDIVSKESKDTFTRQIEDEGRTYASLLSKELSSCRIPLEDLLHIVPNIQPRYYTIASSSSCYPSSVHLTVSVTERTAPSGALVKGLCSSFLHGLVPGKGRCRVFTRESLFRLPPSVSTPIIMVGPGSGIAPMRALLQERKFQADQQGVSVADVTNILYFGCKSRKLDFLYQEELMAAAENGQLTSLKLAFSREQKKKVYVQNLMAEEENASELANLIVDGGAHVFVCGGTGMGHSVHEALTDILSKQKGMSTDDASTFLKNMQKNKTYKQELWSV